MNLKKILVGIDGIKAKGEIDREITTTEKLLKEVCFLQLKASQQMEHSI